jgi:hypothetical protein
VHIVPKNQNGTDDPRNGLTLCARFEDAPHHWAFDAGLFTLCPRMNPRAASRSRLQADLGRLPAADFNRRADSRKFERLSLAGQRIHAPQREAMLLHSTELEWHQGNSFGGEGGPHPALE